MFILFIYLFIGWEVSFIPMASPTDMPQMTIHTYIIFGMESRFQRLLSVSD